MYPSLTYLFSMVMDLDVVLARVLFSKEMWMGVGCRGSGEEEVSLFLSVPLH